MCEKIKKRESMSRSKVIKEMQKLQNKKGDWSNEDVKYFAHLDIKLRFGSFS